MVWVNAERREKKMTRRTLKMCIYTLQYIIVMWNCISNFCSFFTEYIFSFIRNGMRFIRGIQGCMQRIYCLLYICSASKVKDDRQTPLTACVQCVRRMNSDKKNAVANDSHYANTMVSADIYDDANGIGRYRQPYRSAEYNLILISTIWWQNSRALFQFISMLQ